MPVDIHERLDAFHITYNTKHPHQGRGMKGRMPIQALRNGLKLAPKPDLNQRNMEEEMNPKLVK